MAGKAKGGLGKTARSSQDAAKRKAYLQNTIVPHQCFAGCGKPISLADHLPVKSTPGWRTRHYHRSCYVVTAPPGPASTQNHPETKMKQVKWTPPIFRHGTGWAGKEAARAHGYTRQA